MPPPAPSFWQLLQGLLGPTAPPSVPRGDIVLPSDREPAPEPPLGWLAPYLEGGTELIRGAAGLGEQGPAGPTWMNAGALLSALPLTSLPSLGRGLFSRVDDVLRQIPAKGIHPNKIASWLRSGATAEEAAYRGIPEFLASKGNAMVTPAELQAHLAAHPAPVPVVKMLGDAPAELIAQQERLREQVELYRKAAFDEPSDWVGIGRVDKTNAIHWAQEATATALAGTERQSNALAKLEKVVVDPDHMATILHYGKLANESQALNEMRLAQYPRPKYAQYQVPGGEQYRETLLTLPPRSETALGPAGYEIRPAATGRGYVFTDARTGEVVGASNTREQTEANARAWAATNPAPARPPFEQPAGFQSGHWDQPNVLVHTRQNERVLPTGERGRFLEEIQSDWHQKGKAKGYGPEMRVMAYYETPHGKVPIGYGKTEAAALADIDPKWKGLVEVKYESQKLGEGVPDAPFKDLWPDLALKQQLLDTAQDPKLSWLGVTGGKTQAARYDLSKQVKAVHWYPERRTLEVIERGNSLPTELARDVTPDKLADYIGKEAAKKLVEAPVMSGAHVLTGLDLQVGGEGMQYFYDKLVPSRLEKLVKPFGGKVEPMTVPGTTDQGWMVRLTPEMKARILKEGLPLLTVPLAVLGAQAGASEKR